MPVKLKINGKDYEVGEGLNLLQACSSVGVKVPHFCFHPGLGPDGNCRMCQVEIVTERGSQLVISCNTSISDGMVVETNSERARTVRAGVEEFLLLNHPLDCPVCDKAGECKLQNYYMAHDGQDSFQEFPKLKKRKAVSLGATLVLDQERCILCDRCVRFLRDIAGSEELYIAGRGDRAYLTAFPGRGVTSPYSLNTVDLCPVGALTSKDFRFASPVWFLSKTPSVCTTCARGCSTVIDHRVGKIFRMRPRHNPDVNGYWMCDQGRLNYKFVNEDRVSAKMIAAREERLEISYQEVLNELRCMLDAEGGSGTGFSPKKNMVLLASAASTVEELFALKHLAAVCLDGAPVHAVLHVPDGEEDQLLRRRDHHPNAEGARLLSLPLLDLRDDTGAKDAGLIKKQLGSGGVILATGFDYEISSELEKVFASAGAVALLAACNTPLAAAAGIVIPGMTFAGKQGTVVNFQGRAQELHPANVGNNYVPEGFDLPAKGTSQWKVLSDLVVLLGGGEGFADIRSLRKAIAKEEKGFAAVDLNSLGEMGAAVK